MNVDESFNWDVSMKAIENEGIKLNFPLIGNPADKINVLDLRTNKKVTHADELAQNLCTVEVALQV